MAKVYNNDKGFLLIECDNDDAEKCNFGLKTIFGRIVIDCITNENNFAPFIYVACLNDCILKKNIDNWIEKTPHYEDYNDVKIEKRNYNHYANLLDLPLKV